MHLCRADSITCDDKEEYKGAVPLLPGKQWQHLHNTDTNSVMLLYQLYIIYAPQSCTKSYIIPYSGK